MNPQLLADTQAIIESCFDLFPNSIIGCFNGGKDATVLLDLIYKLYSHRFPGKFFSCLYVEEPNTFPELTQFVQETVSRYKYLKLTNICGSLKHGIQSFYDNDKSISGFFLATRRTDLSYKTKHIHICDHGWPPIYRLQPLLDWSYSDVWEYIQKTKLPYCSLYDQGYSSLGSTVTTSRNPHLITESGDFLPPWALHDIGTERKGRN